MSLNFEKYINVVAKLIEQLNSWIGK